MNNVVTFKCDDEILYYLDKLATKLRVSRSEVIRMAISVLAVRMGVSKPEKIRVKTVVLG